MKPAIGCIYLFIHADSLIQLVRLTFIRTEPEGHSWFVNVLCQHQGKSAMLSWLNEQTKWSHLFFRKCWCRSRSSVGRVLDYVCLCIMLLTVVIIDSLKILMKTKNCTCNLMVKEIRKPAGNNLSYECANTKFWLKCFSVGCPQPQPEDILLKKIVVLNSEK